MSIERSIRAPLLLISQSQIIERLFALVQIVGRFQKFHAVVWRDFNEWTRMSIWLFLRTITVTMPLLNKTLRLWKVKFGGKSDFRADFTPVIIRALEHLITGPLCTCNFLIVTPSYIGGTLPRMSCWQGRRLISIPRSAAGGGVVAGGGSFLLQLTRWRSLFVVARGSLSCLAVHSVYKGAESHWVICDGTFTNG